MNKRSLLLLAVMSIFVFTVIPAVAYASSCGEVETAIVSCSDSSNGIWGILEIVVNILTGLVLFAAIGGIIYGAILYASAADDSAQVMKAKMTITNTVIGLVIFIGMYPIIQYLIPGGVFDRDYVTQVPAASDDSGDANGNDNQNNGSNGTPGSNTGKDGDKQTKKSTVFQLASYNVLGFDHNTSASKYSNVDRMKKAAEVLKDQGVEVAVINEINVSQQRSLLLGGLSGWKGTGLKAGNQDTIILWDATSFKLLGSGTYNIPVILGRPQRPQPWVKLQHKDSKRAVFIFGLHLSLDDNNQRTGANQAVQQVRQRAQSSNTPFVVAGDMNSNDRADPVTYNLFNASGIMNYTRKSTKNIRGDNCDTHHSLRSQDCRPTRGSHIDQVWVSKKPKVITESYTNVVSSETAHISDHNPIVVKLRIPK